MKLLHNAEPFSDNQQSSLLASGAHPLEKLKTSPHPLPSSEVDQLLCARHIDPPVSAKPAKIQANTISCELVRRAIAAHPKTTNFLCLDVNPCSQSLSIWSILSGILGIPKAQQTMYQINLETEQPKNKWLMLSFLPQKRQFVGPFQSQWIKLSLVRILFFIRSQRNTFKRGAFMKCIQVFTDNPLEHFVFFPTQVYFCRSLRKAFVPWPDLLGWRINPVPWTF